MKVAIISDLHDNAPYLEIFLNTDDSRILLIGGDIGRLETLEKIAQTPYEKIYFVFGNADLFESENIPPTITNLGESGLIELDNKRIGLCHEPKQINVLLKQKPDIIFYGHTHKPWLENRGGIVIANPGTLGGVFYPSTFAVWDTDNPVPELKRTEKIR